MMQDTGGGSPNDDIFKRISQLINIRDATMEIVYNMGPNEHMQGNFQNS